MNVKRMAPLVCLAVTLALGSTCPADPVKGYQATVKVDAATRMDWTFAVGIRSLASPTPGWLPQDYDSTKQQYELFVPEDYNPKQSYPLVLFISPGNGPAGWKEWEPVCKQHGVLFASPYDAGNNTQPGQKRFRIVLDVLDDVRGKYNTDPDRTYISGFSGGGRVAGRIAFALPEHFGGVVPVCASGEFRDEEWLRHRMIDRLSVGQLTGDKDFNRGECERYKAPWLTEVGVRSRVWVVPGMGHAIPGSRTFAEAFLWLEDDLPRRRELAKKYPGTRIMGDAAPTREEWSNLMLAEGKQRLQTPATVYSGLMVLRGSAVRWFGLPASGEALKIVAEYDAKPEKPWDQERHNDRLRFAYGRALGLTQYVTGNLPAEYAAQRGKMAGEALQLWEMLLKDGKHAKGVDEAKVRIPELRKLVGAKE